MKPAPFDYVPADSIAMAVDAIKNGALDFIEKPFRGSDIVLRVREAIEAHKRRQADADASNIARVVERADLQLQRAVDVVIGRGGNAPQDGLEEGLHGLSLGVRLQRSPSFQG